MICLNNSKVLGEDLVSNRTIKYQHQPQQAQPTLQLSGFNNGYLRVLEKEGLTPVKIAVVLENCSLSSHLRM